MKTHFAPLVIALALTPALSAATMYQYRYEGQPFSTPLPADLCGACAHVSFTVAFAADLGPNRALKDTPAPASFSVSDGVRSFNSSTLLPTSASIALATGPDGSIVLWNVAVRADLTVAGEAGKFLLLSNLEDEQISWIGSTTGRRLEAVALRGTWARSTIVAADVPEPRNWLLAATGAIALFAARLGGSTVK